MGCCGAAGPQPPLRLRGGKGTPCPRLVVGLRAQLPPARPRLLRCSHLRQGWSWAGGQLGLRTPGETPAPGPVSGPQFPRLLSKRVDVHRPEGTPKAGLCLDPWSLRGDFHPWGLDSQAARPRTRPAACPFGSRVPRDGALVSAELSVAGVTGKLKLLPEGRPRPCAWRVRCASAGTCTGGAPGPGAAIRTRSLRRLDAGCRARRCASRTGRRCRTALASSHSTAAFKQAGCGAAGREEGCRRCPPQREEGGWGRVPETPLGCGLSALQSGARGPTRVSAGPQGVRPGLSPDGGGLPDIAGTWTHHPKFSAVTPTCPLRPSL